MECKKCKYWTRISEKYADKRYGNCNCEKFIYDDVCSDNIPKLKNDCLLYSDYESYRADFETGENFGCIHFKKVDDKK